MRTRTTVAAALLPLAALTACSGNSDATPKTVRVTVTQTVTASPSKPPAPEGPLKLGDKATLTGADSGSTFTTQALSYTQPVKNISPPFDGEGGDVWAAIEVKVCNTDGDDFSVSQFPWHLAYADGSNVEVTGSYGGDMPKPEFPMDRKVKPGDCARGKIAFPVSSDKRPERIVYEPDGVEPTEWAVPKS